MSWLIFFIVSFLSITSFSANAEELVMVQWIKAADIDIAFQKHLRKLNPDVNIKYINGNRNKKALVYKLESFDFSNTKVVYSFGTTTTKIVKNYLKGKKPQIFNAVSTPMLSNIVPSLEKPGNRITGVKLLVDIERQIEFLSSLKKIRKLAVWYDPRENYTQDVLGKIIRIAKKKGITVIPFRIIPDADDFEKYLIAASKRSGELDALYFVMSPSFHLNYKLLHSKLSPKLLKMGPTKHFVEHGCTVAMGPDIIERAETLAEIANAILRGKDINEIPVSTVPPDRTVIFANKKALKHTGVTLAKSNNLRTVMIGE